MLPHTLSARAPDSPQCEEVEKKGEMDVRKLIEEELSKIAIRPCPVCKTPIVKLDGCNKSELQ